MTGCIPTVLVGSVRSTNHRPNDWNCLCRSQTNQALQPTEIFANVVLILEPPSQPEWWPHHFSDRAQTW
jgi:hypothetical protein